MRWIRKDERSGTDELSSALSIPRAIAQVLSNRGFTVEDARIFLDPRIEDLYPPFMIEGVEKAARRVEKAIDDQETILIHGDYDVDGVTSLALLYRNLRKLGAQNIIPYIPSRFDEGYGLSEKGIEVAESKGASLIITVDCGVTAVEEARLAKKKGIDLIITDHHEPGNEIPDAFAVINPKLGDYPFPDLAGVGVTFKFLMGLYMLMGKKTAPLFWDLDLVTLGTVADLVPLINENRILVKYGLITLNKSLKAGINALKKVARLNGELRTWHISFILAPRLNAAGRLSHAQKAFQLLVTTDGREAAQLARELNEENRRRQQIESKIYQEARSLVEEYNMLDDWVLVLGSPDWHEGVIGIVASKLVEDFYRPTLMISVNGETAKGSGRSIPSFHLFDAMREVEDLFEAFGGHKYAAGFKIDSDNIDDLRRRINEVARRMLSQEDLVPEVMIDAEIDLEELNEDFFKIYEKLSPFGQGNPRPIFCLKDAEVVGEPKVVGENHLKFAIRKGESHIFAFAPRKAELIKKIRPLTRVDLVFTFTRDEWARNPRYELRVIDLRFIGGDNERLN